MRVAVLGASGFVGTRLMEKWILGGTHDVRAIVRGPSSLARMARFALPPWKQADVFDAASLAEAVRGCDAMVHAFAGDPGQTVAAAQAAVEACKTAGVRRLVYLSSASVHGHNPAAGTNDLTPLRDEQPSENNNAKVRAERVLREASGVEACILRPGIVYGPRCPWFVGLPLALHSKQAFLVEGGHGFCNHIHVDNLIHAIEVGLSHARAMEGAFYVADSTCLTWREFYRPIAQALGFDISDFQEVSAAEAPAPAPREKAWRMILPGFGRRSKEQDVPSPPSATNGFELPQAPFPVADHEISQLHICATRLPMDRAVEVLGYAPPLSTAEGLDRSARWLAGLWLPRARPLQAER